MLREFSTENNGTITKHYVDGSDLEEGDKVYVVLPVTIGPHRWANERVLIYRGEEIGAVNVYRDVRFFVETKDEDENG